MCMWTWTRTWTWVATHHTCASGAAEATLELAEVARVCACCAWIFAAVVALIATRELRDIAVGDVMTRQLVAKMLANELEGSDGPGGEFIRKYHTPLRWGIGFGVGALHAPFPGLLSFCRSGRLSHACCPSDGCGQLYHRPRWQGRADT
jgi:hypothetical protein